MTLLSSDLGRSGGAARRSACGGDGGLDLDEVTIAAMVAAALDEGLRGGERRPGAGEIVAGDVQAREAEVRVGLVEVHAAAGGDLDRFVEIGLGDGRPPSPRRAVEGTAHVVSDRLPGGVPPWGEAESSSHGSVTTERRSSPVATMCAIDHGASGGVLATLEPRRADPYRASRADRPSRTPAGRRCSRRAGIPCRERLTHLRISPDMPPCNCPDPSLPDPSL
jgi:hypothetical protein